MFESNWTIVETEEQSAPVQFVSHPSCSGRAGLLQETVASSKKQKDASGPCS